MSESISEYSVTALYFIIQKFLLFSDAMCYTSLVEWIAILWCNVLLKIAAYFDFVSTISQLLDIQSQLWAYHRVGYSSLYTVGLFICSINSPFFCISWHNNTVYFGLWQPASMFVEWFLLFTELYLKVLNPLENYYTHLKHLAWMPLSSVAF